MIRIAPSEKAHANAALEKRLWSAAEPAVPAPHVTEAESQRARPEGLLGLIFLRYVEVCCTGQHAKLKAEYGAPGPINHR